MSRDPLIRIVKREIKKLLDPITPLSLDVMPETQIYPHAVMTILPGVVQEGLYLFMIDIDIWDKSISTAQIDDLGERISTALNRLSYYDSSEHVHFVIHESGSGYPQDQDKTLRRRTCTFEVQARKES